MEGMEEENSVHLCLWIMHWEAPDLFWVCGGQPRAHMQEADNS